MRNKVYYLGTITILCLTLLGFSYRGYINEDPIAKIITQLNKWRNSYLQEKVHLQLDKSIYTVGEDIWFKAYVVNGENHQLSAISAVLHVELIDEIDSVKQFIKLPIAFGMAFGNFPLSNQLKTGSYRVRAYTNYMRNPDRPFLFEKTLFIVNPNQMNKLSRAGLALNRSTPPIQKSLTTDEIDFQLFPEGGYLVNGLSGKLAFKATTKNGRGINIKGVIRDNLNNDIVPFVSTHYGMGQVVFTPISGRNYKAVATLPNGSTLISALPNALDEGIKMSLIDLNEETIAVGIKCSKLLTSSLNKEIYVVAQQNGKAYYAAKTLVNDTSFIDSIAKKTFPTGIVQFTMFSSNGLPISERIIFIQNNDALAIEVNTDKQIYNPREKVNVAISLSDLTGKMVEGNFSVAVVEEKRTTKEEEDTSILSNLLLTSDLRGYIENPNYYFKNNNAQSRAHLDLLMLIHGYRNFEWKKILDDKFPEIDFPPEKALSISGHLKTSNGKFLKNSPVTLFSNQGNILFLDTLSDSNGKFSFNNLHFQDSTSFVIQALDGKNKAKIEFDTESIPTVVKKIGTNTLGADTSLLNHLKYESKIAMNTILLKEIVITNEKKILKYSANLNGTGRADQIITAEEISQSACIALWQCLQGKISGVIFQNGTAYSIRSPNFPMRIVLDGMLMPADFSLSEIVVSEVQSVEVLKSMALSSAYGADGGGGMLIITMKRGEMQSEKAGLNNTSDAVSFYPKGYQATRKFYSPKYEVPKVSEELVDPRSTLFWEPNIFTVGGKANFTFFNSDSKGVFKIIIEGIADDGKLARQTYNYEVK